MDITPSASPFYFYGTFFLVATILPRAFAPHDVRRTCARLCHEAGGELEQIQFLLGHASVQPTERYIGCKQNLKEAVNDRFQISLGRHGSSRPRKAHDNPVYHSGDNQPEGL